MKRLDEKGPAADPARPVDMAAGGVWQPRGGGFGARAIASLIPRITQKSFEKHGFAAASLIMDWAQVVGHDRARNTRPLQLKWPRAVEKFNDTAEGCEGRPGATLVLQVDPAVALDIQYQSAQLIERINAYFGYRAVANLRIVQEVINTPPAQPGMAVAGAPGPKDQSTSDHPDASSGAAGDPLAAALARLGAHVGAQSRCGKQD